MDIREIDRNSDVEIGLVAERMRQTLVEVLGEEVGASMYTMEWLVDRVKFHLDPDKCTGAVFLSVIDTGITGHTIVRLEIDDEFGEIGLFSTTYVIPEARRHGTAGMLLWAGEHWILAKGRSTAVTYTDTDNKPLQKLYQENGYQLKEMPNNFVALSKRLA
jgi:GNAT superfamily N-acetyltransferase